MQLSSKGQREHRIRELSNCQSHADYKGHAYTPMLPQTELWARSNRSKGAGKKSCVPSSPGLAQWWQGPALPPTCLTTACVPRALWSQGFLSPQCWISRRAGGFS